MSKPVRVDEQSYRGIARAIDYMVAHYAEAPSMETVAREAHMSRFHFQRTFREYAGLSPKRFLQFLTLAEAKRRLSAGESMLQASENLELSSQSRLYDLFVSCDATTPGEYKSGGEGLSLRYGLHTTVLGTVLIGVTERGICRLVFADEPDRAIDELQRDWPEVQAQRDDEGTAGAVKAALAFLQGAANAQRPKLHVKGTNFQLKVWEALLRLPAGCLTSYGMLASSIGRPGAARAVGSAVGHNPIALLIPCHRVIRASGALGGYAWGETRKRALLAMEEPAAG